MIKLIKRVWKSILNDIFHHFFLFSSSLSLSLFLFLSFSSFSRCWFFLGWGIFCCQLLLRPFWPMAMQMPQLEPEEAKIFLLLLILLHLHLHLHLLLLHHHLLLRLLPLLKPPFNQSPICIVLFPLGRFYFSFIFNGHSTWLPMRSLRPHRNY